MSTLFVGQFVCFQMFSSFWFQKRVLFNQKDYYQCGLQKSDTHSFHLFIYRNATYYGIEINLHIQIENQYFHLFGDIMFLYGQFHGGLMFGTFPGTFLGSGQHTQGEQGRAKVV